MCSEEKAQQCEQAPDNEGWGHWNEVDFEVILDHVIQ